jgi:hypothetical protein
MNSFVECYEFPKYEVSREGIIRKKKNKGEIKLYEVGEYMCCMLYKDTKKGERVSLHRLLGLTFIPNPENKPVIDHIDRNTKNNNLDNLRWATLSENRQNSSNIRTEEYWKNYKKDKAREYRANMSENKHQEILLQKKETYDNDKQKEYVNRPEVKAKRLADQQKKRDAIKIFKELPFNVII